MNNINQHFRMDSTIHDLLANFGFDTINQQVQRLLDSMNSLYASSGLFRGFISVLSTIRNAIIYRMWLGRINRIARMIPFIGQNLFPDIDPFYESFDNMIQYINRFLGINIHPAAYEEIIENIPRNPRNIFEDLEEHEIPQPNNNIHENLEEINNQEIPEFEVDPIPSFFKRDIPNIFPKGEHPNPNPNSLFDDMPNHLINMRAHRYYRNNLFNPYNDLTNQNYMYVDNEDQAIDLMARIRRHYNRYLNLQQNERPFFFDILEFRVNPNVNDHRVNAAVRALNALLLTLRGREHTDIKGDPFE